MMEERSGQGTETVSSKTARQDILGCVWKRFLFPWPPSSRLDKPFLPFSFPFSILPSVLASGRKIEKESKEKERKDLICLRPGPLPDLLLSYLFVVGIRMETKGKKEEGGSRG